MESDHTFLPSLEGKVPETYGKRCPRCRCLLRLNQFHKDRTQKDGLQSRCIKCQRSYRAAHPQTDSQKLQEAKSKKKLYDRQRYLVNKAAVITKVKRYYQANKAVVIARVAKWAAEHPERVKERKKKYRSAEKGKLSRRRERVSAAGKQRQKRYQETDKGKESRARIKGHRRGVRSTMTTEQWRENKHFFHDACAFCGRTDLNLTRDHFVPIRHKEQNKRISIYDKHDFVPACMPCQRQKRNEDPFEFLRMVPPPLASRILQWRAKQ